MATANTNRNGNGNGELRHIPLARIVVKPGHNPRGEVVEDDALKALAETMRQRGCLQPIIVRAIEDGEFELIAGERRYRAAALAGLIEMPASVRSASAENDADEALEIAADALIENELRSDLNPLQRASAYQSMFSLGDTVRGLAERLGGKTQRASREKRIKEHLAILKLTEDLQALVADGKVPVLAVKTLIDLAKVHEEFARRAVVAVLNVDEDDEPYTWAEIVDDGLRIAAQHCETLPPGVFETFGRYPVEQFTLGEKAIKNLAAFQKLTGCSLEEIVFATSLVDAVRPLGVVHDISDWKSVIVGQDVGDRIAEDYIATRLKEARAEARSRREYERQQGTVASQPDASQPSSELGQERETEEQRAQRLDAEARAKRAKEKEDREAAIRFNESLGILAFKHLTRIKVDDRVLRILASVDLGGDLRGIASLGARLALPGWITKEQRSANAKVKAVFLDAFQAEKKAAAFLEGADSVGEVAGRALTLIALASLADESAIAISNRSPYWLSFKGAWAAQARRDLNAIVAERIKEGQLPELDALLAERRAVDEEQVRCDAEVAQAEARLDGVLERLDALDTDELEQAVLDAELAWGTYALNTHRLRDEQDRRAAGEPEPQADNDEAAEVEVEQDAELVAA